MSKEATAPQALGSRIDVHGHYMPPAYKEALARHGMTDKLDGFPAPQWDEEIQDRYMAGANITQAVLSISSPLAYWGDIAETVEVVCACNDYGADYHKRRPDIIACGALPLPDVDASVSEVRRCRDRLGIRQFSILTNSAGIYLGDKRLAPLMEELDLEPTTLVIHPTSPAAIVPGVNEGLPIPAMEFFFDTTRAVTSLILGGDVHRYPNVRFLVPHAGAFLPVLSDRLDNLAHMLHFEGVDVWGDMAALYYDLAGMAMPKQYGLLRQVTDLSHIMYGSDGPFTPLSGVIHLAADMDAALDDATAEQVYRQNPQNLFDLCA